MVLFDQHFDTQRSKDFKNLKPSAKLKEKLPNCPNSSRTFGIQDVTGSRIARSTRESSLRALFEGLILAQD